MRRSIALIFLVVYAVSIAPLFPIPKRRTVGGGLDICEPIQSFRDQVLDHFNFQNNKTFMQRIFICDQFYDGNPGTPIFFYTGNEGPISMFYDNSGFVFEAAQEFNALVVFAEHRYYGETLPFGSESFLPENIGYLSVEQALADYVSVINWLQEEVVKQGPAPVVAFGGSYGGLLTAWMRLHYPDVVIGGIAASAPVRQYLGGVDQEWMFNDTSNDYAMAANGCADSIRSAFATILSLGQTSQGRAQLTQEMSLCSPLQSDADITTLVSWATTAFAYTALIDYPYATDFLNPVPANPVSAMCALIGTPSQPNFMTTIANALGVFYNFTGQEGNCFNISVPPASNDGIQGWYYQICTQVILYYGNDGVNDMFLPPNVFDQSAYVDHCQKTYGVNPDFDWWPQFEGGPDLQGLTNVFFSNGQLDPWGRGGILANISNNVIEFTVEQGAHHLDLRASNPADPESVIQCRQAELQAIRSWIAEFRANM